jgi:hypothetical protein
MSTGGGNTYTNFIFHGYHFDKATKTLKLNYGFDDQLKFTEEYIFDFPLVNYSEQVLDRACQNLFFLAGVSYYKAYRTEDIRIDHGQLDPTGVKFFAEVYQKGLGEYFYVNKLSPKTEVPFVANAPEQKPIEHRSNGGLVIGIGGGKDSLVSVELLRHQPHVATWSLGHRSQMEPLVRMIGLPHMWVERKIDPLLLELNNHDALNGHIPISAIFSCVGTIVAILSGRRDNVVSNENSSNEPTLRYDGVDINHQYSKSLAYEQLYQKYLAHCFGDSLRYYSFLRPFSEVRIAAMFSELGFKKYKSVFSSCNRAYIQGSDKMSWCGLCSKCAFTFLALTPFVERKELEKLWHKNLLLDPVLVTTYENLLGISGDKPLDCVGEVKESREAMRLAQKQYPGLSYEFDIPKGYSYQNTAPHSMPEELYTLLERYTTTAAPSSSHTKK